MQKKVIHVTTQEEYDKVMEVFDKRGWNWFEGGKPKDVNLFDDCKEETCIDYHNKFQYWNIKGYKEEFPEYEIISFQQFLQEEGLSEKKPSRIKHTYTTTFTRDDGVQFTKDTIDGVSIDSLKEQEMSYYEQARAIRAKLNAHSKLKF